MKTIINKECDSVQHQNFAVDSANFLQMVLEKVAQEKSEELNMKVKNIVYSKNWITFLNKIIEQIELLNDGKFLLLKNPQTKLIVNLIHDLIGSSNEYDLNRWLAFVKELNRKGDLEKLEQEQFCLKCEMTIQKSEMTTQKTKLEKLKLKEENLKLKEENLKLKEETSGKEKKLKKNFLELQMKFEDKEATVEEQKNEEEEFKTMAKQGTDEDENNILNQPVDLEEITFWQQNEAQNIFYPKIIPSPLDPTLSEIDKIRAKIKDLSKKIPELQKEIDIKENKIISMKNEATKERESVFKEFYKKAKKILLQSELIKQVINLVIMLELQSKGKNIDGLDKKIEKILKDLAENIEEFVFFTKTPQTINGYTSNVPEIFLKWDYLIFDLKSFSDYLESFLILAFLHEIMHYVRRMLAKEHEEIEIETPKLNEPLKLPLMMKCGFENEQEKSEFLQEEAGGRVETLLFGHQLKEIYETELKIFLDFSTIELDFIKFRQIFKENRKNAVVSQRKSIACRDASRNGVLERGACAISCLRNLK